MERVEEPYQSQGKKKHERKEESRKEREEREGIERSKNQKGQDTREPAVLWALLRGAHVAELIERHLATGCCCHGN